MKVYVVTGNDFPDAVFSLHENAKQYCNAHREEETRPRIYWRIHEFELDAAKEIMSDRDPP